MTQTSLRLVQLECDESTEGDTVTQALERRHDRVENNHGAHNEQDILDDTGEGENQGGCGADEENEGQVEGESAGGVGQENERADFWEVGKRSPALNEGEDESEHAGADGGEVVDRHEGIHLESLEQDLDHDQAGGLEENGDSLENEAEQVESGLAVGGDGDAAGDAEHDEKLGRVGGLKAECDGHEEHGDRGEGFDHLDVGDAEVEVGVVAEDERGGEEGADGENIAHPAVAGHFNAVEAVEEVGVAGKEAGADGGKGHMEGGEEDGVLEVEAFGLEDVPGAGERARARAEGRQGACMPHARYMHACIKATCGQRRSAEGGGEKRQTHAL